MNNAHLKLNSMSEFTALWNSGERFQKFAEQVYRYLERMKPGTVLVLERYSGEQLEWIIKTACVFILEGNNVGKQRCPVRLPSPYPTSISYKILVTL